MKTLCVSGHRPKGFPWNYKNKKCKEYLMYIERLRQEIYGKIEEGYTHFISGGALGVDTDFALFILEAKKSYPHITLEIAIPCYNQDLMWSVEDKQIYKHILENADKNTLISDDYTPDCMQKRNMNMVEKADCLLAVWNGIKKGGTYNTIKYAKSKEVFTLIINLQ